MKLRLVHSARLYAYKDQIKKIGAQVNDPDLFENIFKSLADGVAFLFESIDGFVVLKPKSCETGDKGILVWVVWTRSSVDRSSYLRELEFLAKDIEAKYIEMWSARKGLVRVMPAFGYSQRADLWKGVPVLVWKKFL